MVCRRLLWLATAIHTHTHTLRPRHWRKRNNWINFVCGCVSVSFVLLAIYYMTNIVRNKFFENPTLINNIQIIQVLQNWVQPTSVFVWAGQPSGHETQKAGKYKNGDTHIQSYVYMYVRMHDFVRRLHVIELVTEPETNKWSAESFLSTTVFILLWTWSIYWTPTRVIFSLLISVTCILVIRWLVTYTILYIYSQTIGLEKLENNSMCCVLIELVDLWNPDARNIVIM